MPTLTHVHTYIKYKPNKWNKHDLYRCDDPHCTHFDEKSAILGKATLCNQCGVEFILTRESLRRIKPRCLKCSNTKEARTARAVSALIDSLSVEEVITRQDNDPPEPGPDVEF